MKRLLLVLVALCVGLAPFMALAEVSDAELDVMYRRAMEDAVWADGEEILPLVMIDRGDGRVTWDEAGERILLLSWHGEPESYPAGRTDLLTQSEIWTFTDGEIFRWYEENREGVEDWTLRLEQLIGLPRGSGYTHFTAFWAEPADVIRPAYVTDTGLPMQNRFSGDTDAQYRAWFDANILYSYFESAYPWTRLGYTYDWADDEEEYGLSEFLLMAGSPVSIAYTVTTDEFLALLDASLSD